MDEDNLLSQVGKANNRQFVIFNIGKEKYGVEISRVREIIKPKEITRIPNMPDYVEGVTNIRGQVTTVFNLRKRLGFPAVEEMDKIGRIIIVEYEGIPAGILVDDVRDVKYISDEEIDKVPSIISKSKGGKFLTGVGKIKDDLILLVDLDKIFSLEDLNI
jgi:purine-binding chemotaxis protein CheW